ncbi:flagellar outer dynein arm light chain 5 [Chlorella sorokiniana]|uniref:Flagellar outer dynein arm light chain 5 n=1 Tax=Chlorella sorokiniana TaxID=3076 RepID=A0A2P6TGC7_CHLSO|nr:flagellar outer dynein arm light chain 5 [Chlorella sorokiniana]|eukprot:PRW33173.1 flagellar outer dynein arm light chain 5 [Chlorella sorokiniana]
MPLTATELAHCRCAFVTFDRNSDGVIDADELRAALVTLGHPAPSDAALQRMLETMDKDHSGAVEFEEFLQVIEAQKAQQVARCGEADTVAAYVALGGQPDKGGQVSVERLARTLAAFDLRIDLDRLLAEMDLDANGSVSYAEFKALLAGTAQ